MKIEEVIERLKLLPKDWEIAEARLMVAVEGDSCRLMPPFDGNHQVVKVVPVA